MAKFPLAGTTRYQRIALGLFALALINAIGFGGAIAWVFWALALVANSFRKQLLWRVRNRLIFTFFLLGVVPLILIGLLLMFAALPFLGHLASEQVRAELESRIAAVGAVARAEAAAGSRAASPEVLDTLRQSLPRMSAAIRTNSGTFVFPSNSPIQEIPPKLAAEFQGVMEFQGSHYIAARAKGTAFGVDVLVYVPLDEETRRLFTPGVVEVADLLYGDFDLNSQVDGGGARVSVTRKKGGVRTPIEAQRLPSAKSFWDVPVAGAVLLQAEQASGGTGEIALVALSRASLALSRYTSSRDYRVTMVLLTIIGGIFLIAELFSLVRSILHTREITGSVHDLYLGTLKVAEGDFTHQIPVRGKHQLSDLAVSFNSMSSQIQHFLGEMKKKDKIESELEIARQVQSRLFPRTVPELKTLEMQGVCIPGRFISGDYYDFVKLNDRYTAIALGDVSGKGVSAALLMASIQASLHAQLGFARGPQAPVLSTATLMALIGQQLYESTPAEKYATFFCSVYDDETGVLRYTNAGHLQPILVREGKASPLPGDGMVVGLLPNVKYEQQEIQLLPGDLVAIFSDGIPEAENAEAQEYGEGRLSEWLVANAGKPLEELIKAITASVDAWAHDPAARDDTTIVVMRRLR